MGVDGYIVHNHFVYKSTSPHTLTYTVLLIVFAYVFYQKIWPTVRRLMACGLRVAVNITYIKHLTSCVHAYLLQVFRCIIIHHRQHRQRRRDLTQPTARFRNRIRRISGRRRKKLISEIRYWVPPAPSPLAETASASQCQTTTKFS